MSDFIPSDNFIIGELIKFYKHAITGRFKTFKMLMQFGKYKYWVSAKIREKTNDGIYNIVDLECRPHLEFEPNQPQSGK